jgi:hypothetical protein
MLMYDNYVTFRSTNPLALHVYLHDTSFDERDYFFVSGEKMIPNSRTNLKQFDRKNYTSVRKSKPF